MDGQQWIRPYKSNLVLTRKLLDSLEMVLGISAFAVDHPRISVILTALSSTPYMSSSVLESGDSNHQARTCLWMQSGLTWT